MQVYLEPMQK